MGKYIYIGVIIILFFLFSLFLNQFYFPTHEQFICDLKRAAAHDDILFSSKFHYRNRTSRQTRKLIKSLSSPEIEIRRGALLYILNSDYKKAVPELKSIIDNMEYDDEWVGRVMLTLILMVPKESAETIIEKSVRMQDDDFIPDYILFLFDYSMPFLLNSLKKGEFSEYKKSILADSIRTANFSEVNKERLLNYFTSNKVESTTKVGLGKSTKSGAMPPHD